MVKYLPDDSSNGEEAEVTKEDIIKNYSLLYAKWVIVIENNKKLNQNVVDLKIENNTLKKNVASLMYDKTKLTEYVTLLEE